MSVDLLFWLVPVSSLIALGFAFYFYKRMLKEDEGTPTMREIAAYVRKGAMAYLKQQYKRRLFLGTGRIYRHEDSYIRFGQDCQRRPPFIELRS